MRINLRGGQFLLDGRFERLDLLVDGLSVSAVSPGVPVADAKAVDVQNCIVIPGLVDVHVHLREPGFLYKETMESGTAAAARGGFAQVLSMPNLNPVPDCAENLAPQLQAIRRDARVRVLPYGAITRGQRGDALADLEGLAVHVAAFSDDGRGVRDTEMMRAAMREAKRLGKIIAAHCEDECLVRGGYIHDGAYARAHGHRDIPSESEWRPIERDLKLAEEIECKYHICHVSAKESVRLIRAAKARGVDVTCETAPHYLLLDDSMLQEDGRFKMNPPIRARADREALLEGLLDGTIDMIATDHAPHTAQEKGRGLADSAMGVVGLETSFPSLYTHLVKPGIMTLPALVEKMHHIPARRFGLETGGDLAVFDLEEQFTVDPDQFLSLGRATPFRGWELSGACRMTIVAGKIVWQKENP